MIVKRVYRGVIEDIAKRLNVRVENLRQNRRGDLCFVLRPNDDKYRAYTVRYERVDDPGDLFEPARKYRAQFRRKGAVCWHGHRDFMRAIFVHNPEASINTCLAQYRNAEDFEDKYEATGENGGGPMGYGMVHGQVSYSRACRCSEVEHA